MAGSAASPDVNLADGLWVPGNPMPINVGKSRRQRVAGVTAAQTTTTAAYGSPTTALGTGFKTLYVCPSGVKALASYFTHFPLFSSNGASQQLLVGRSPAARASAPTYADVLWSSSVGNTAGSPLTAIPIVMQPGDVLWIMELNRAGGATGGWDFVGSVTEVDDPNNNIVVVSTNVTSTAVVFTAPTGRKAHLLAMLPDAWVGGICYNLNNASEPVTSFLGVATAGPTGQPAAGASINMGNFVIPAAGTLAYPGEVALTLGPNDTLATGLASGANGLNVNCGFLLE